MSWIDIAVLYMTVANAVIGTAPVWGPLLLAVAALLLVTHRCAAAGRRHGHAPDMSGPRPDSGPDTTGEGTP
jgi:hypothetical protein